MATGLRRSNDELKVYKQKKIDTKYTLKKQEHFVGSDELLKNMQLYEKAYREGKPIITDEEWDKLVKQTGYEESLDEVVSPDGRTWIKMKAPLPSLKKIVNMEDLKSFINQFPNGQKFIVEPKLDGLTWDAIYKRKKYIAIQQPGESNEDFIKRANIIKEKMVNDSDINNE
jgi:NAD-dependent DNA ligase